MLAACWRGNACQLGPASARVGDRPARADAALCSPTLRSPASSARPQSAGSRSAGSRVRTAGQAAETSSPLAPLPRKQRASATRKARSPGRSRGRSCWAGQHRELLPEHEQFDVLGQLRPPATDEQFHDDREGEVAKERHICGCFQSGAARTATAHQSFDTPQASPSRARLRPASFEAALELMAKRLVLGGELLRVTNARACRAFALIVAFALDFVLDRWASLQELEPDVSPVLKRND